MKLAMKNEAVTAMSMANQFNRTGDVINRHYLDMLVDKEAALVDEQVEYTEPNAYEEFMLHTKVINPLANSNIHVQLVPSYIDCAKALIKRNAIDFSGTYHDFRSMCIKQLKEEWPERSLGACSTTYNSAYKRLKSENVPLLESKRRKKSSS